MTIHGRLATFGVLATMLGSLSLIPVLAGGQWFWSSLFGVVLLVGTGEVCRQARVARPLIFPLQCLVLIFFLTARFASHEAILGLVPGPAGLSALREVIAAGMDDISRYAAPVPADDGITALAAGGVCLVGLLVDLLAVTLRRAALAGLPLLALYSVPAAVVKDGVNWLIFTLAGFGYLALLLTEGRDRVTQWGRPLITNSDQPYLERALAGDVESSPLVQLGRKIGAAALGLAVVVPALLPSLTSGLISKAHPGFGSGGSGTILTINPMATLLQDLRQPADREILRVKTDNPNPQEQYLRDATLDEFNGAEWKPSKSEGLDDLPKRLPTPDGLADDVARKDVHTSIKVSSSLRSQWLPMPETATRVQDLDGSWRFDPVDRDLIADDQQTTAGQSYKVTSLDLSPTAEQLNSATYVAPRMRRYLALPDNLPSLVLTDARLATKGAKTPYEKAVALQNWFLVRGGFVYSTDVKSGHNVSLIADFLTKRAGYCEQFAATMAVMARQLGIPARVAVGFTAGQRQSDGSYVVKTHDRHAWPELYFDGVGWIRFEPTPSIAGTNGNGSTPPWATPDTPAATPNMGGLATGDTQTQTPESQSCLGDGPSRPDCKENEQPLAPSAQTPAGGGGGLSLPLGPTALAVVLAMALAVPAAARTARRRRRLAAAADPELRIRGAWAELHDTVRDYGHAWDPSETPRQVAARLIDEIPLTGPAADGLSRIARATERLRYARRHGPIGDLFADVRAVSDALAAQAGRRGRWRVRLLPRSTVSLLSVAGERIAHVLFVLDQFAGRLRTVRLPRSRSQGASP